MKKLIVASAYPLRFSQSFDYKSLREVITTSRLSIVPDEFHFKLASERISDLKSTNLTFNQCCEQRVQTLEALNQPIFVLWSGGIDSTGTLVSILKFGSEKLRKRTTVLFNIYSLREYREIFPLIAQNFQLESSFHSLAPFIKNGIIVTGELGDQLFGSDLIFDLVAQQGKASLFEYYGETLPKLFKDRAGHSAGQKLYDRFEKIVAEAPFEIKRSFDFLWWWNFSQKWQHVKFRFLISDYWPDINLAVQNVKHFYDSPEFQGWSLTHQNLKIGNDLASYKQVVKDLIVQTTKHDFYQKKLKMGSLGYIWFGKKAQFAVDENFEYVKSADAAQFLNENPTC